MGKASTLELQPNQAPRSMSDQTLEERRWATAIRNAAFGVWDLDPRLDTVHYPPQWKTRLGFPRIDAPDNCAFWRCRVHPDDFNAMLRALRSHLDGSSLTYEVRFRLRSNGSGYRTMLSRGRAVARDDLGNATRMIGTMVDLTGRPLAVANYGLATEEPGRADVVPRLPFHAAFSVARQPHGLCGSAGEALARCATDSAKDRHRRVELIDDLLDVALRDAHAAA